MFRRPRKRPTETESERDVARALILRTANRFALDQARRRRPPMPAQLHGARHIQQAVCVARRNRLVDADTLVAAGFRAEARR